MSKTSMRSQAGFTLVELAIVMIIIGLLIGGVLKGQELINNAQITSTVAQVKGIEAATSTFRDTYSALPGDMLNAAARLPNCAAAPCVQAAANGDGRLALGPGADPTPNENEGFFVQLNAASLLTGITPGNDGALGIGVNYPAAKLSGNGIQAGSALVVGDLVAATDNTGASSGLYLTITNTIGLQAATTTGMRPNEALRVDAKLDDSNPNTGGVRAFGGAAGAATCANQVGAAGIYNTNLGAALCGVYVRIQG